MGGVNRINFRGVRLVAEVGIEPGGISKRGMEGERVWGEMAEIDGHLVGNN